MTLTFIRAQQEQFIPVYTVYAYLLVSVCTSEQTSWLGQSLYHSLYVVFYHFGLEQKKSWLKNRPSNKCSKSRDKCFHTKSGCYSEQRSEEFFDNISQTIQSCSSSYIALVLRSGHWSDCSGGKHLKKEELASKKKQERLLMQGKKYVNVVHSFADLKPGYMAISIPGQDFSSVSTHTAAGSWTKATLTVPWRHKTVLISSKDTSWLKKEIYIYIWQNFYAHTTNKSKMITP